MTRTEEVTIILGEKGDRTFAVEVTAYYDKGDYYQPSSVDYEVTGEFYDVENECICDDLVYRYENINKVNIEELAIEEFINQY